MSVTLFFQSHLHGENQEIPTQTIVEQFEPFITRRDEFGFEVVYDAQNSSFVFIDLNLDFGSHFSINRPCTDRRLYVSIYNLMQLGNFVFFWGGEAFYLLEGMQAHLPEDMQELLGGDLMEVRIVTDLEGFVDLFV